MRERDELMQGLQYIAGLATHTFPHLQSAPYSRLQSRSFQWLITWGSIINALFMWTRKAFLNNRLVPALLVQRQAVKAETHDLTCQIESETSLTSSLLRPDIVIEAQQETSPYVLILDIAFWRWSPKSLEALTAAKDVEVDWAVSHGLLVHCGVL